MLFKYDVNTVKNVEMVKVVASCERRCIHELPYETKP